LAYKAGNHQQNNEKGGQPESGSHISRADCSGFCMRLILFMAFFEQAITVLQTLVIALGAGLGIWGVINLLEGYGNDNPGANAHVR